MARVLSFLWLFLPLAYALDYAASSGSYLVNNRTKGLITLNGIWYHTSNSTTDITKMDPLTNAKACTRDAVLMSNLGLNLIYVGRLDPLQNHDDCFSIFNSVGIYIVVVLRQNLFLGNIYAEDSMQNTFQMIESVKDYENLLALDIGTFPEWTAIDLPKYADMQKTYRAIIRDTRSYVARHSPRPILVGGSLPNFESSMQPSKLTMNGSYEHLTCRIPGEDESNPSWAEYVAFENLEFYEKDQQGGLNKTLRNLSAQMRNATTPVWMSAYSSAQQNGQPTYIVYNETLVETAILYNQSWSIVLPYGNLAGGARFEWTNVQLGDPAINWYLTVMDENGNMQLTQNYDYLKSIFQQYNTESWLSGNIVTGLNQLKPRECKPELILNRTSSIGASRTISLATDWALPTRPSGLDAMITSGVKGKRGQMVDVLVTTVAYQIRDSKNSVTEFVLSPSQSQARRTTSGQSTPTGQSSSSLSTGTKAGIGAGASVGGLLIIGSLVFLLLRRRRRRAEPSEDTETVVNDDKSYAKAAYTKAELSAGPGAEVRPSAELPSTQTPKEVPGEMGMDGYPGMKARMDGPPVELPAIEIPQELPTQPSPADENTPLRYGRN